MTWIFLVLLLGKFIETDEFIFNKYLLNASFVAILNNVNEK